MDYNQALDSQYVVMAQPAKTEGEAGWKAVAQVLSEAHKKLKKRGMKAGLSQPRDRMEADRRIWQGRWQ